MRLTDQQIQAIVTAVHRRFGSDARVSLFGSRADDAQRGGDIDLLVELPAGAVSSATANTGADPQSTGLERARLQTIGDIQRSIGDQKIDLVVTHAGEDDSRLVVAEAHRTGVPL